MNNGIFNEKGEKVATINQGVWQGFNPFTLKMPSMLPSPVGLMDRVGSSTYVQRIVIRDEQDARVIIGNLNI